MDDWLSARKASFANKFSFEDQFLDSVESFKNSLVDGGEWQGISINWEGRELKIVDPTFVNYCREKIRFWLGGFVYLLFIVYAVRKVSAIIAGQGGAK